MKHSRTSGAVSLAVAAVALIAVAFALTVQESPSPATPIVDNDLVNQPFPTNDATREDLPDSERAVLAEMKDAGLLIRDQFT